MGVVSKHIISVKCDAPECLNFETVERENRGECIRVLKFRLWQVSTTMGNRHSVAFCPEHSRTVKTHPWADEPVNGTIKKRTNTAVREDF